MRYDTAFLIGGPWAGEMPYTKFRTSDDSIVLGYYQYKSEWHPQTFIYVWKELLD